MPLVCSCRFLTALLLGAVLLSNESYANKAYGYELELDVVYGQGRVLQDGKIVERDLMLDVYRPSDSSQSNARPAVVLVHGGAHHRGGRRQAPYKEAGAVHSRMED